MTIVNSQLEDIPEIFRLYKLATGYQKIHFPENQWPEFDPALIRSEVLENRQFKIVMEGKVACIWAITFSDPEIWEEKENNDAIYIHRIATNPEFRGNNFVQAIVDWAIAYAAHHDRKYIRMDTCGKNDRLIEHYQKCGFAFLGIRKLKTAAGLPAHYIDADVCFFEIALDKREA